MRPDEHLSAEAFYDVALRIKFIDGVVRFEFSVGKHAVHTKPASSRDGHRARLIASYEGPDAFAVDVHVY
jgi:hypothetical protein